MIYKLIWISFIKGSRYGLNLIYRAAAIMIVVGFSQAFAPYLNLRAIHSLFVTF